MKSDLIVSISAWRVRVPLMHEWAASEEFGGHNTGKSERLILCLRDEAGNEGWGEGQTGLSNEAIEPVLQQLVGKSLSELRLALLDLHVKPTYWHQPLPPSPYAPDHARLQHRLRHPLQVVVEMAALDLIARRASVPLYLLFGGAWRDRVPVDYWMGRTTPELAYRCVQRAKSLGFTGIKLKTALHDPNVERLEAIRDAGGPDWHVTVDPNGRFYSYDESIKTIRAMDAVGNMSILEDPFSRTQLHEFAAVRRELKNARLVLHIDPPESIETVIHARCVGGLNIDSHTQGLTRWRQQAAMADQANLPVWHGSGLDLGIATCAQLHVAAATPNCVLPGDQSGPWLREATLVKNAFVVAAGHVLVPQGVGSGAEPDLDAIDRYSSHQWNLQMP